MYYLLNINIDHVSLVDHYMKAGFAPIFWGMSTIDDIKNGKVKARDAVLFVETFSPSINTDAIVFSIGEEYVYFYKQKSPLRAGSVLQEKTTQSQEKGFDITIVATVPIIECPLVLVTIKFNRYMSAGTFRPIEDNKGSYFGNCRAADYILSDRSQPIPVKGFERYLQCLSSLEFETLIAKIYEDKDYFVPAYKGGFLKNYDLFCIKDDNHREDKPIQIKLHLKKEHYNKKTLFYCITTDVVAENVRTADHIQQELKPNGAALKWLQRSLYWVQLV